MSPALTILIVAAAMAAAIGLAYLPMRLLVEQMAKGVRQFIQRQRDRRRMARSTPDRRRTSESP